MISGPLPDISEGISSVSSEKGLCVNLASSAYDVEARLYAESQSSYRLKLQATPVYFF